LKGITLKVKTYLEKKISKYQTSHQMIIAEQKIFLLKANGETNFDVQ